MPLKKRRGVARNYNGGPITFSEIDNGKSSNAMMRNYSVNGMNFISDFALKPGSNINIEMLNKPVMNDLQNFLNDFHAKVIWCRRLSEDTGFAIGIKFNKTTDQ